MDGEEIDSLSKRKLLDFLKQISNFNFFSYTDQSVPTDILIIVTFLFMSFLSNLEWRYATKKFDTTRKVSSEDLDKILEAIRLTPTSF